MHSFNVDKVTFGSGNLSFILGPCVVESAQHALFMAQEISDICKHVGVDFVYKSSFDKANRSSIESFRGGGMEFGLEVLAQVKDEIGVPVITDIHEPWQAEKVAEVAEKAKEAAAPGKVEPAKKEVVEAAAPAPALVVKGDTHYYGRSEGPSIAAWSAEAVMNPSYVESEPAPAAEPEETAAAEAQPESAPEPEPIAEPVVEPAPAPAPAKTVSGVTAYYGIAETPDAEHDWASEAEMNPDYEATPIAVAAVVEERVPYKTEPGVTAQFGGASWQAPENYYAPVEVAAAPAVKEVRVPYKTETGITAVFGGEAWVAPDVYHAPVEAPAAVVVAEAPREPYKTEPGVTTNSMRRFWALPSRVALSAMGLSWP